MLSVLDTQLFPDSITVLKKPGSQDYIYPIHKNGSSSLMASGFSIVDPGDYKSIETIQVFVREPYQRFLSGVNTYLKHNFNKNRDSLLDFISEFLFINNHFCPQFYWLVNLQRFTTANILLRDISSLKEITPKHKNFEKANEYQYLNEVFENHKKLHFYLALDKVLYWDMLNKTVTMPEICSALKQKYPDVYTEVIERSKQICGVLD